MSTGRHGDMSTYRRVDTVSSQGGDACRGDVLDIRIDKRSLSSSHIRDRRASYTPLQALRQDETRDLPGDLDPSHPFAKPAQRFKEVSRIDAVRDGKPYIRPHDIDITYPSLPAEFRRCTYLWPIPDGPYL